MKNIQLGMEGKDKITGFTGIITGKAEALFTNTEYQISPSVDSGSFDPKWFSVGRIKIIGNGILLEVIEEDS